MPGHEPELARAGQQAVTEVMNIIRAAAPDAGSYVNETDYHQPDWQRTVPLVARTAIITAPLVLAMTYPR